MRLIDYIDPVKTTIAILKDWNDQHWKAEYGKEQISEIVNRMTSSNSRLDKDPIRGGGTAYEDALVSGIDKKTVIEHGYNLALDYIGDLQPCWDRLSDDEKFMLRARFIDRDEGRGIDRIMAKLYIGKTEAYDRSNAALTRLSKLIFW